MLEYKRERNLLENKVEQLDKKATYHDDHIRVMDAWWDQVREFLCDMVICIRVDR